MLKKFLILSVIFGFFSVFPAGFSNIFAQNRQNQNSEENIDTVSKPNRREVLGMLNLSPEQTRQVRITNREWQPKLRAIQQRFRQANLSLDEAIYAENTNEAEVRLRLTEVENAQKELLNTRILYEMNIRRILNPEQVAMFREIRLKTEPRLRQRYRNNQNNLKRQQRIENRRRIFRQ